MSNNLPDAQKMAKLDMANFTDLNMLKIARENAREIRKNVPKIVQILLKNRQLKDRLEKEFAAQTKNSDIKLFWQQFEELRKLWNIHMTTSKEEVESVNKGKEELKIKTEALEK